MYKSSISILLLLEVFFTFALVCQVGAVENAGQAHKKEKAHKSFTKKIPDRVLRDPNWIMLDHVEAVFKIIKVNRGKCNKTLKQAVSYVNKHKIQLLALRKQAQEANSSMCPKARNRVNAIILSRAEKLGDKYSSLMFEYYKKCPYQADRLLTDAMQFLGSKCKEDH